MFHFPTFPPPALCVQAGAMGHYAQSGFPIRKSPDRSLVADSPGLIAGSYVLLRLLVPRHSPCALINLATTDDARVHCAVLKIRAVPAAAPCQVRKTGPAEDGRKRPFPQDPTACPARAAPGQAFHAPGVGDTGAVLACPGRRPDRIASAPLMSGQLRGPRGASPRPAQGGSGCGRSTRPRQLLLRKEVIQPHLPVRLPCYDFVPIAGPTFDGSLPYGLGHRLRVLPTFVT